MQWKPERKWGFWWSQMSSSWIAMSDRIGTYPWVSSRAIDVDAVDVSFSGTPSKTTRRHRCCWTPWKGGQVSNSSQKEEWHTLVCRRTPCRQLPRRWTGSDTRFQRLPHQLQHMQGHQLPRSRDLRSGVKHLSHLFKIWVTPSSSSPSATTAATTGLLKEGGAIPPELWDDANSCHTEFST